MLRDQNQTISMIGKDGRIRTVPFHMKEKLLQSGFGIATNAKEEYYPEYDNRNTSWSDSVKLNITEDITPSEILDVELI